MAAPGGLTPIQNSFNSTPCQEVIIDNEGKCQQLGSSSEKLTLLHPESEIEFGELIQAIGVGFGGPRDGWCFCGEVLEKDSIFGTGGLWLPERNSQSSRAEASENFCDI